MVEISDAALDEIIAASKTVDDFMRHVTSGRDGTEKAIPMELPSVTARRDRQFIPSFPVRIFTALAPLPGKALAVYLILWRRSRIEHRTTVPFPSAFCTQCGLTRHQRIGALHTLARHGLVTVTHRRGKSPLVTLCTLEQVRPRQEETS